MAFEQNISKFDAEAFQRAFVELKALVDILLQERHKRKLRKAHKDKKKEEAKSSLKDDKAKGVGGGSDPLEPPSPSSSSSSSSLFTYTSKKSEQVNKPKIKLDVKFDLPMYCGELNAEKLDDWIQQVEVYCRVQNLLDDVDRIQLATLRLGGTALTWWESKAKEEVSQHGRVSLTWAEFVNALKK